MSLHFGIPQIILLALYCAGLMESINDHGKIETKKENAWTRLAAIGITLGLLYWGGFFK